MKNCIRCDRRLPLEMYYVHPMMGDGHLSVCKECVKARVRKHRAENLGRIQSYDRSRGQLPHRKAAVAQRGKTIYREKSRLWRQDYLDRNPQKMLAHRLVKKAIKAGELKPLPCERCGFAFGIQAHHEDYSKPLDVNWLCIKCHGLRHREINEERRRAA